MCYSVIKKYIYNLNLELIHENAKLNLRKNCELEKYVVTHHPQGKESHESMEGVLRIQA